MTPIASTQPPYERATYALRTSISSASTSPSKTAPNPEVVRVRRATGPSTASSTRAVTARPTRGVVTGCPR